MAIIIKDERVTANKVIPGHIPSLSEDMLEGRYLVYTRKTRIQDRHADTPPPEIPIMQLGNMKHTKLCSRKRTRPGRCPHRRDELVRSASNGLLGDFVARLGSCKRLYTPDEGGCWQSRRDGHLYESGVEPAGNTHHASMLAKLSYPDGRNRKVSRIYGNALLVTAPKRLRR